MGTYGAGHIENPASLTVNKILFLGVSERLRRGSDFLELKDKQFSPGSLGGREVVFRVVRTA